MSFDTFRTIFFIAVVAFMAYVFVRIAIIKWGEKPPPPPRKTPPPSTPTREGADTFGTSGVGASDMTAAGFDVGDTGGGGDSGGGGWND